VVSTLMHQAPLNEREKLQALVFQGYLDRKLSRAEAQRRLSLPSSTFYRRLQRFKTYGKAGLAHQLRGKLKSIPILTSAQLSHCAALCFRTPGCPTTGCHTASGSCGTWLGTSFSPTPPPRRCLASPTGHRSAVGTSSATSSPMAVSHRSSTSFPDGFGVSRSFMRGVDHS
jgi:hypothetical protein